MAAQKATRDGRGGRKSEVITIRLDPRLKYLAELAARRQRRPLSSYVEWAIEQSLSQVHPSYDNSDLYEGQPATFADVASYLWDVDESDRFACLAFQYPELLTHEEQVVWKLIKGCGYLWRGKYEGIDQEWTWKIQESSLMKQRLRETWSKFLSVASGERPPGDLPKWQELKPLDKKTEATNGDDPDDDIPF